ncbi:MAG: hypothetical protein KAS30_04775, partial [Candidatus Diapherotrites archaeon]|nr:hypothetical protein [Candidatus Diapherotrites archaeon]
MAQMKKGIVFTFSILLIASILVIFTSFYANSVAKDESNVLLGFAIEKTGFVGDDIDWDVNAILGTHADVNRGSVTTFHFEDSFPGNVNKLKLQEYGDFVDSNYSGLQNANLTLNLGNLTDGKAEMIFSNGLQYDYDYSAEEITIYKPSADSEVITYDINVNINAASTATVPWIWQDVTGDINVNLNFADENVSNAVQYSGKLDSSIENTYQWDYLGGRFYIKV